MPVSMIATPTPLPVASGQIDGVCTDWLKAVARLVASKLIVDGRTGALPVTTLTPASARRAASCAPLSLAPAALISGTSRVTLPPALSTTARRAVGEDTAGANCTMYSPLTGAACAAGTATADNAAATAANAALRLKNKGSTSVSSQNQPEEDCVRATPHLSHRPRERKPDGLDIRSARSASALAAGRHHGVPKLVQSRLAGRGQGGLVLDAGRLDRHATRRSCKRLAYRGQQRWSPGPAEQHDLGIGEGDERREHTGHGPRNVVVPAREQ